MSLIVTVSVVEELRLREFLAVVVHWYVEVPVTYVQDAALLGVWCGECVCVRIQLTKVQLLLKYDSLFPIPLAIHP